MLDGKESVGEKTLTQTSGSQPVVHVPLVHVPLVYVRTVQMVRGLSTGSFNHK